MADPTSKHSLLRKVASKRLVVEPEAKIKEKSSKVRINVRMPKKISKRLSAVAKKHFKGRGKSAQLFEQMLTTFLSLYSFQTAQWEIGDESTHNIFEWIEEGNAVMSKTESAVTAVFLPIEISGKLDTIAEHVCTLKPEWDFAVQACLIRKACFMYMPYA